MDKEVTNQMEKGNLVASFHSQFDPEVPPILQRTTCGIAALYTGLGYLGYELPEYTSFVSKYISHGSYNIPTYSMSLKVGGIDTIVPITYFPEEKSPSEEQQIVNDTLSSFSNLKLQAPITREVNISKTPQRAFTLAHGFDHRGIDSFLRDELGLRNFRVEIVESSKLPDRIEPNSVILASIEQEKLGYPARLATPKSAITTHIIPVVSIGKLGATNVALFADPAFMSTQDGLQVRTIASLEQSLAGKYTIITDLSSK